MALARCDLVILTRVTAEQFAWQCSLLMACQAQIEAQRDVPIDDAQLTVLQALIERETRLIVSLNLVVVPAD